MRWLTILTLCISQVYVCEALTLSDLLTRTRLFLRDTASSSSRQTFSDAQLTYLLNDSQKEVNLRTFDVVSSSAFRLTAGTTEYSLPTNLIIVFRVTVDNVAYPERTMSFLDDSGNAWATESTGTLREYYLRTSSSLVSGVTRESIGFHPASSNGLAVVEFLAQPTDLVNSGDIPFGGDNPRLYPFHHILAYRAAYLGYLALGDLEMASVYMKEYENMIPLLEAVTKTRLNYNPNLRGNLPIVQAPMEATPK